MTKPKLRSVLVANRGEIACRIFKTAKSLGMRSIAVFSEADKDALFVREADEAHLIGPAPVTESYLQIDRIVAVGKQAGADCIHPGYGFLSERAEFAEACAAANIIFIGPPPSAIRAMGLKDAAKDIVSRAGVPVVPGYHGNSQDCNLLIEKCDEIGYPVLIKAVAGGGGKGMRRVDSAAEFAQALSSAQREAQSAFGDPRVLLEKYVLAPRHIEFQIFADSYGNVVHLFERDCTLQRRHQKVIEEAPAPGMAPQMREAMGQAAIKVAKSVGYVGAGTIEFIADSRDGLRPDRFFFMEMNTRLQVEHPVTEAITGMDLVELQFQVASGDPLPFGQDSLSINGHAVEARLYAEDPAAGFAPSTGIVAAFELPQVSGIRVDAGVTVGSLITPFYDSMIAKVIAHGQTRDEALDRLSNALSNAVIAGPKTNAHFLATLCNAHQFRDLQFDTGFIDANLGRLVSTDGQWESDALRIGARALLAPLLGSAGKTPWDSKDAFQLGPDREQSILFTVNGERVDISLRWINGAPQIGSPAENPGESLPSHRLVPTPDALLVVGGGRQIRLQLFDPFSAELEDADGGSIVKAPMHGRLVEIFVKIGDMIAKGQRLAVVEAMKMEHVLTAAKDGFVSEILAEKGQQVTEGAQLIALTNEWPGRP